MVADSVARGVLPARPRVRAPARPGRAGIAAGDIAGAAAAFTDREYFEHTCQLVIDSREQVIGQLQALGFEVLPSAANFIFVRHPEHDAAALAAKLRELGGSIHFNNLPQSGIEFIVTIPLGGRQEESI